MTSLLLRRVLWSIAKPVSFFGHQSVKFSSSPTIMDVFTKPMIHRSISGFKSSQFLPDSYLPIVQQTSGMKTKTALKKRCNDCYFVRRRGRLFVYCKTNGKHKQRQG
ncbi:hypothetical protein XELAEV_18033318mg [Xenopus laevis]|uniref:Ribosomal protein n=1 Tax=Xenopus laevis TaxID=8355 RepID=A0A974CJC7_XENLA|nr:hypothetical protein XELAEV_18033318mg [Xenopus laevis]